MKFPEAYRDQEVVVLGLAISGVQVAKIFHQAGARVTVNDKKERQLCPEAAELEALGISVICGGHPDTLVHANIALVVKNPGIPYSAAPVMQAQSLGIEVVTEVEVASFLCQAPIIGITGSNGKTTTTTWVGNILKQAGAKAIVAGNIGIPLSEAVQAATAEHWLVAELSSFQLKGTSQFHPRIACLLNVGETHLDYHGTMEDYIASKAKLFANQTEEDYAVLNWDNEVCRSLAERVRATLLPFSAKERLDFGVYAEPPYSAEPDELQRSVVYRDELGQVHRIIDVREIGIPGRYNVENALAASAICLAAGIDPERLRQPLASFEGVEHRLEYVRTVDGVLYYNNSKATNAVATAMAIDAFAGGIVLIAGGLDRGSDYMELVPIFQDKVKAVVTLGETKDKIRRVAEAAGIRAIKTVDTGEDAADTIRQAVREAAALAAPGDIVLLSPACASWDMFASYEERGRIFKEAAHSLK
ncbi:UDP-N-acetylmuramoyl-L-alanine--D-glutamate ligase [Paenibacillus sp. MSJ-34]|uniref:UDP-N-acetylmuramoyl-L-alanine--D-glutamate ligase n=1 Tax=Paenibacillus sp. MSJ-34 TaxID=2841529 RepID=UPI001C10BEBB|nr:UDP-N-acetylmuramoyl-L-alanine--D-glutamate ligase [Paenibacillus sp. MSJ-34]MBU5440520.1 UDP-N-acetylmuramoyl-L-alanine--D-glutamate ligase [Paenibacillus sp. MSJ-34]